MTWDEYVAAVAANDFTVMGASLANRSATMVPRDVSIVAVYDLFASIAIASSPFASRQSSGSGAPGSTQ